MTVEEQALARVAEMKESDDLQLRDLALYIEEDIKTGKQKFITEGDELVGFAFPEEEEDGS